MRILIILLFLFPCQSFAASVRTSGGGSSSSSSNGACFEDDVGNLMPVSGDCTDTSWEQDGNGDLQPQ